MEYTCFLLIAFVMFDSIYGASFSPSNIAPKEPNNSKKSLVDQETKSHSVLNNKDHLQTTINRHKRWYDFYGFAPPIFDLPDNRIENPLTQIHRRLQDIANVGRQPPIPPQIQAIPLPLIPHVIYIDEVRCKCDGDNNKPVKADSNNGDNVPEIPNRVSQVDDGKDNNINETDNDMGRPISFDPIRPNRTISRPPPPVDHGISQAGGLAEQPTLFTPEASQTPQNFFTLTTCDSAVLSCCHQREVTYQCFVLQGCTDLSSMGNPCDIQVVLDVINRFQMFYAQREQ